MKRVVPILSIFALALLITLTVNKVIQPTWVYKIAFPEQSALNDFQFEDFSFSEITTHGQQDKNIVLVNVGELGRREIAQQIEIISQAGAKVIGVNVFFNCLGPRDTINCPALADRLGNAMLHDAIASSKRVVLPTKLLQKAFGSSGEAFDSLEVSDVNFSGVARHGFGNLVNDGESTSDVKRCRLFMPEYQLNGARELAFPVAIANTFDSVAVADFLKRRQQYEIVNYRGNISIQKDSSNDQGIDTTYNHLEYFKTLDWKDILNHHFKAEHLKDKIVLLGYFGDFLRDQRMSDMFYSPLNHNPLGKSLPDMYASVIDANIISSIINHDYVNRMSDATSFVLSIIIVLLNVWFFVLLEERETVWKEAFIIVVPAGQIILLSLLRYFAFSHFRYIVDLSMATLLLVSVSLSTTLYFGPLKKIGYRR